MGNGSAEDPHARFTYEHNRLVNPETGEIPAGIRAKELAFAKTLPKKDEAKSLTYVHRGPINKGGRTRALALDVLDENIILAGGVTGGMWRSTDAGVSWTSTTDPSQMKSVTSVAQDRRAGNENVWYYGTGEYYAIVSGASFSARYSGDGIFKSTDSGQSWTKLASTSSNTPETLYENGDFDFVWRIVTDHTDLVNDVVLAAVYNGIYRSEDGGSTWTAVLGLDTTQSQESQFADLVITPSGVFYAALSSEGPDEGIYRSDDGINWVNISNGSGWPSSYRRIAIGVSPADENQVFFVAETNGTGATGHSLWKYRYVSGDGSGAGGVWENRTSNMPNTNCTGYFTFNFGPFNSQSSYNLCVTAHPTDTNTLYIGGTNIYRSTDGFTTSNNTDWIGGYKCDTIDPSNYVYPNHHPDNHYMLFNAAGQMYSANDGGVQRCDDPLAPTITWTDLNNGYYTTQFYAVAMEEGDATSDIIIGGMQDNGTWFTNDQSINTLWQEVGIDDGAYCAIAENRDFYLISSQLGRIYKKDVDDNGNILNTQRIDPTGGPSNYNFINQFILDPNNSDVLYIAARNRIWRNDDVGAIPMTGDLYNTISTGWTNINQSQIGIQDGAVSTLDMSEAAPNMLMYGTSSAKLFRLDNANSATPVKTNISSSEFPTGGHMSCIAPNAHDGGEWMATFSNYEVRSIFHTTDTGATWTHVGGNLEEMIDGSGSGPAVFWATVYPTFPSPTYFVGTSVGLFSTTLLDGDNTIWTQEGASTIGNTVINMIKARPFDGKVAVGTHGKGVYSSNIGPAFVGVENTNAPQLTVQHYPNPFTDMVTIEYLVDADALVTLEVLSIDGKVIETLIHGKQSAGRYQVQWGGTSEGAAMPNGVYLYRLVVGDKSHTGRIILAE